MCQANMSVRQSSGENAMKKRTAILMALLLAAGSAMPVRAADTELLRADF